MSIEVLRNRRQPYVAVSIARCNSPTALRDGRHCPLNAFTTSRCTHYRSGVQPRVFVTRQRGRDRAVDTSWTHAPQKGLFVVAIGELAPTYILRCTRSNHVRAAQKLMLPFSWFLGGFSALDVLNVPSHSARVRGISTHRERLFGFLLLHRQRTRHTQDTQARHILDT